MIVWSYELSHTHLFLTKCSDDFQSSPGAYQVYKLKWQKIGYKKVSYKCRHNGD